MRQIFQNLPWVQPAVPPVIASLYERRGVLQKVKRNQVLKAGGDNPKSFLLVRGLCVYRIASAIKGSSSILSLIPPGRSMCDISEESYSEGMVANFTLDPQFRLRTLFKVLITSYGIPLRDDWTVIPLLLNNSQYGQVVNLSRVSVSRIFSQWEAAGLIRKDRRSISVRKELFSDLYDWIDGKGSAESTYLTGYGKP